MLNHPKISFRADRIRRCKNSVGDESYRCSIGGSKVDTGASVFSTVVIESAA